MELKTAIEILEYHQEWRLGKRDDMIHEPKKLTEALDVVLEQVKGFTETLNTLKELTNVKVKFFHHEWDNYQGASGKVFKIEKIVTLNDDAKIFDIKNIVVSILDKMGYKDDWEKNGFTGRGIINMSVI
jgi:hypothetical protein